MSPKLKPNDLIRVRLVGTEKWTRARVALASRSNPQSVAIILEDAVRTTNGGLIGAGLPLTLDYTAETATSLWGDSYEIEVAE